MTYASIDDLLASTRDDLARLVAPAMPAGSSTPPACVRPRPSPTEIGRGGFVDNDWVSRWDLAFAELYVDALEADRRGGATSGPWRVAFDAATQRPDLAPLQHALFGINAHINYDLPQALLAVISPADFDDAELVARRTADHRGVDAVLQSRVGAEDDELGAVSRVRLIDRLLRPANRAASRRFLAEAREKVWRNTVALDRARRTGAAEYAGALLDLGAS